jgi:predicted nucleotidyltransferase
MGQKEKAKILGIFFEEPNRNYQIRKIAKITGIPKTTVSRYIQLLVKQGLVKKVKGRTISFVANETNPLYKFYKKMYFLEEICKVGLAEYLEESLSPKCIILFGSFAKGEYSSKSDIDLFVQAKEQKIDLSNFERKLKHRINIFFEEKFENLSKELFNNIINGMKLSGYIKLK